MELIIWGFPSYEARPTILHSVSIADTARLISSPVARRTILHHCSFAPMHLQSFPEPRLRNAMWLILSTSFRLIAVWQGFSRFLVCQTVIQCVSHAGCRSRQGFACEISAISYSLALYSNDDVTNSGTVTILAHISADILHFISTSSF